MYRLEWNVTGERLTDRLLVIKVCAADKTESHEHHNHLRGREGSMCDRRWEPWAEECKQAPLLFSASIELDQLC